MTLHVPAHRTGLADHHWVRDLVVIGVVAVLAIGGVWALSGLRPFATSPGMTEAQSLVEFRAGERASWAGTSTSEQDSLIRYRASERELP